MYHSKGRLEDAETCFKRGIDRHPTVGIYVEYAHFLIKEARYQEGIDLIQVVRKIGDDGSGLGYGESESDRVLSVIKQQIAITGEVSIPAIVLADYLEIFAHIQLSQSMQSPKEQANYNAVIKQKLSEFQTLQGTQYPEDTLIQRLVESLGAIAP